MIWGATKLKNLKSGGKDSEINQGEAEYQALKAYISSHSIPIDDGQLTDIC